jgi:hypothetical protein
MSNNVTLVSAKITGQVNMKGIKIDGKLDMNSISIGSHLIMNCNEKKEPSEFNEVDLFVGKIHGMIEMKGAKVKDTLNMASLSIGSSLVMSNAQFQKIKLEGAKIGDELNLTGVSTTSLFLDGAHIRGNLKISFTPKFGNQSFLSLHNTQVGTLQDGGENSWPSKLDLAGFTYRLSKEIGKREKEWFIDWLAKTDYLSQPYHQLATTFITTGNSGKANDILYAGKNRERSLAWQSNHWGKWLRLSLLNWTIGYGLGGRYFRSLLWVFVLAMTGVYVLYTVSPNEITLIPSFWDKLGFSIDKLLPIIELDDRYKLSFHGWQLYYFYLHELMGFLLGSFVVAGLSGITKK